MSKRPFAYLGAAAIVAIVIIFIDNPFGNRVDDASFDYFVPGFDVHNIQRFDVEQMIDGSQVRRSDDVKWEAAEKTTALKENLLKNEKRQKPQAAWKEADTSRVLGALGSFGGLSKGILVSTNPEKRHIYQVGPTGLHVIAFDKSDEIVLNVIIGKGGPDFMSTYVRPFDKNEVYLVNRNLTGIFSPRSSDWLKREHIEIKEALKEESK
ncbi:MAG: DUF4340 domain-containing protein [Deltaproteobacteria bacterium]|jgi:hypothetical protein|nr:DUF4340 domain-containing protein [Deltaproteobacteria bacterium]